MRRERIIAQHRVPGLNQVPGPDHRQRRKQRERDRDKEPRIPRREFDQKNSGYQQNRSDQQNECVDNKARAQRQQ